MNSMMKASIVAFAALGLSYATLAEDMSGMHGKAATAATVSQTKCPVLGGTVDKSLYIDSDGKRIYVCCKDCLDKVRKSPGRYIKELEEQGITLDKAPAAAGQPQTKCPVMHGSINKDLYVDVDGKRIYVCCDDCLEVIKKDPKKYVNELEAKGIVLDKAK